MREDDTLQIVIEFPFHIGRQTSGVRIRVEGGHKGFQMVGNDAIEHGGARIVWDICGWGSLQWWRHGYLCVFSMGSIELAILYIYSYVHYIKS
jgi:hypothetical protein